MIAPFVVGELIFWAPIVIPAIIAIFQPMMWTLVAAIYGVWVIALPAIPIQLTIIVLIKKLFDKFGGNNDK